MVAKVHRICVKVKLISNHNIPALCSTFLVKLPKESGNLWYCFISISLPNRRPIQKSDFLQLVSQHFVKHHDLAFYAGHLNMTTTYLSRIVKQMSGHTVQHFICD